MRFEATQFAVAATDHIALSSDEMKPDEVNALTFTPRLGQTRHHFLMPFLDPAPSFSAYEIHLSASYKATKNPRQFNRIYRMDLLNYAVANVAFRDEAEGRKDSCRSHEVVHSSIAVCIFQTAIKLQCGL